MFFRLIVLYFQTNEYSIVVRFLGVIMNIIKRLTKIYNSSIEIPFDDSSKFIIMSDCHRGDGNWSDTFSKNQNIYFVALSHYYNNNYTYIELGDGDELWEITKFYDIIHEHSNVFWLMTQFYKKNRFYSIYGNHDLDKKNEKFVKDNLYKYFSERDNKYYPMLENIKIYEGLVLNYKSSNDKILLIHGHQVDFLNYNLWRMAKFLVRYFWKPLESIGINDITRTAKNYKKKTSVAKKLTRWVTEEKHILIAGHNHRPRFPSVGEPPYFNDGSCVHPRCITGIEISNGCISLIKWSNKTNYEGYLYVGKDIIAGPEPLINYFDYFKK